MVGVHVLGGGGSGGGGAPRSGGVHERLPPLVRVQLDGGSPRARDASRLAAGAPCARVYRGARLTIEVNSARRAQRLRDQVEERLGEPAVLRAGHGAERGAARPAGG